MKKDSRPNLLFLVATGFILPSIASRLARRAMGSGYEKLTDNPPPRNPAAPEVDLKEALLWTALAGAVGGVARMATRRALADTPVPAEGHDMDEALIEATQS